jgi:hypothetical protein
LGLGLFFDVVPIKHLIEPGSKLGVRTLVVIDMLSGLGADPP